MLFNSFEFCAFFIITFIIYYLPPLKKHQVLILVTASIYFYSTAYFKATFLLLLSIGINSYISYLIYSGKTTYARFYTTLGVVLNLGILFSFKYTGLFLTTFLPQDLQNDPLIQKFIYLPLPIGISFFTFEGISLMVDVYKKRAANINWAGKSFGSFFLNTAFFISFFPHLIAGPILKANSFMPQIGTKIIRDINWNYAFKNLITGYFLKMVIADNLKEQTMFLSAPFSGLNSIDLLSMLFAYSIQIFADFAGYSLIAIGLAELLGYNLIQNFNFPYISSSFSEFWKRWHISLSNWLKEYLYFPLGGNRKGEIRTYFNLFVVMLLGGLWHGAAWSYALWGSMHGFALVCERFIGERVKVKGFRIVKISFVFTIVTFAWLFFKLPNIQDVWAFYQAIISNFSIGSPLQLRQIYITIYTLPVLIYYLIYISRQHSVHFDRFLGKYSYITYSLMAFMISFNSGFGGSFIYFRF